MIVKELVAKHAVNIENTTAVIGVATTALGAVAIGEWRQISIIEVLHGAGAGMLGGLTYVFIARVRPVLTAMLSAVLAAAWSSFLAPTTLHAVVMARPNLGGAIGDAALLWLIGGAYGALGVKVYEGLLSTMDALGKALGGRADELWNLLLDIISKRFGGGK